MSGSEKHYDRDVDSYGIPRWFSFIITGGPLELYSDSGPLPSEDRTSSFDWPFPQSLRLAHYMRRAAKHAGFDDDDA